MFQTIKTMPATVMSSCNNRMSRAPNLLFSAYMPCCARSTYVFHLGSNETTKMRNKNHNFPARDTLRLLCINAHIPLIDITYSTTYSVEKHLLCFGFSSFEFASVGTWMRNLHILKRGTHCVYVICLICAR